MWTLPVRGSQVSDVLVLFLKVELSLPTQHWQKPRRARQKLLFSARVGCDARARQPSQEKAGKCARVRNGGRKRHARTRLSLDLAEAAWKASYDR